MTAQARGHALQAGSLILGVTIALIVALAALRIPVVDSVRLIGEGAFADRFALARTAVKSTPLLFCGLGMVVAWRAGMYNIGGEGQYITGALASAALAKWCLAMQWTGPVAVVLLILAAAFGGALWAAIAGWLFLRRGVEVVISTILLNFIAVQLLGYLTSGPLQEAKRQVPQTDLLPNELMLGRFDRQLDVHVGCILALVTAAALAIYLFRTVPGYRLRVVGENRRFAAVNYIKTDRVQMSAMAISGALCGLAGASEYLGIVGQLGNTFPQQWGFLGIPVALLGGLHPIATVFSAIGFGALFAGTDNLARFTTAGPAIVYVIQAVTVLAYVFIQTRRRPTPAEDT
ncbi:MAG: ABC transporter permease [Fimbriimonadaceae bacterium]|nr:ABC transporter permease [Fimbriimonadaceae bacterium]